MISKYIRNIPIKRLRFTLNRLHRLHKLPARIIPYSTSTITANTSADNLLSLDPDLLTSPEPIAFKGNCKGCGAIFQHDDQLKPGYIPPEKFLPDDGLEIENEDEANSISTSTTTSTTTSTSSDSKASTVCQRCFHLTHYNNTQTSTSDDPLTAQVLTRSDVVEHIKWIEAFPPTALCIKVIDALDLHGTIAPQLVGAINTRRVLLAINKSDVLPKGLTSHELQIYARKVATDAGVKNIVGCVATSALRGAHGTTELTKQIKKLRQGRNVYMVGVTNVGKSTLFNNLKKPGIVSTSDILLNKTATVSSLPGTTMLPLKVRFGKGSDRWDMHDTPGIVVNRKKHDMLTDATLRKELLQTKAIKPKIFSVQNDKTLFFGGLWRLDLSFDRITTGGVVENESEKYEGLLDADDEPEWMRDGTPPRLLFIWNGHLNIHPTSTKNADSLFERQGGKLLAPALMNDKSETGGEDQDTDQDTNQDTDADKAQQLKPFTCLLQGTAWDLASFDIQDRYETVSLQVSNRKARRGERQRTPLFDIDMGGLGWLTVATAYDDYMSVEKRRKLLQRANIKIWGHEHLKPVVRETLMPNQAGLLRSKQWKTV